MAATTLQQARRTFQRQDWATAYGLLRTLDDQTPLEPEDLERAGHSAYLTGRDDDCVTLLERAFHERTKRSDPEGAALDAFWLFYSLMNRGESARAGGWIGRGHDVLGDHGDCAARGYLTVPEGIRANMEGDAEGSYAAFTRVREIAGRFAEHDLEALGGLGQGQALITGGRFGAGAAVFDEIMLAVVAGEASAVVTGIVYCAVVATCMEALDARRAREWTAALDAWCQRQPDLVPFRGQCLVHRSQLMRMRGAWDDALAELQRALPRLDGHPAAGEALYEQAEIHRLRGDFEAAERAFHDATAMGRDAQPGLALLRLRQGRAAAASAGVRRSLGEAGRHPGRALLLSAAVEIALRTGDIDAARDAATELSTIAAAQDLPLLSAMAAHADGALLLAEGDALAALTAARRACALRQDLGMPYESALARVVIGAACRSLGDEDAATMELDAAREVFATLGANSDAAGTTEAPADRGRADGGRGLTARETEVLRKIATGMTNRAIAGELVLSEKTVARHVSNILTKLDLPSRAAATAYAYVHGIV